MNIEKLIQKYKTRIAHAEENINDYTKSNNSELLNCVPVFQRDKEHYEILVFALEKQIPKEPIKSIYNVYFCPVCNGSLWQNKDESNYCFRCGQKIKLN
jgi:rubrerythrin